MHHGPSNQILIHFNVMVYCAFYAPLACSQFRALLALCSLFSVLRALRRFQVRVVADLLHHANRSVLHTILTGH